MTTTTSSTYTTTAPDLAGVWLHDMADPEGTERNLPYHDGAKAETVGVQASLLQYVGRDFPVVEYGDEQSETVAVSVKIPQGSEHRAGVAWLRARLRAQGLVCYRDGRGRVVFGSLGSKLGISDTVDGSVAQLVVTRLDYTEGA